jgi:glycosyltransferase involved in cell wall biosynthesis
MRVRLVILTEIISPYRIPVFNQLAQHPEIDLHVIFLAETDSSMRQWRVYTDEIRFSYEVLPSWRQRLGNHNLLINKNVGAALGQARPDVILCGGYNYPASWQALRWAKRGDVPFFLWCESTAGDKRNLFWLVEGLKQTFLNDCTGFVVPGTSALEYVRQMTASDNIFVAPNAVDISLFSAQSEAARIKAPRLRGELGLPDRFFLYVGRLVRAKGVLDLLEAYASLEPRLRCKIGLVYVGDGPLRAELETAAQSLFPGCVHFAGFVDRDELASYYSLAECLVLPTHSDTWGMVVNEAMACGSPVICTTIAGCAADLVRSNGRLVSAKNVSEISNAMREIASDLALRSKMSAESHRLIQNYSPECCAEGIASAALSAGADCGRNGKDIEQLASSRIF